MSVAINGSLGAPYFFVRKYDLAIQQYKKTLQMDPNFGIVQRDLFWTYTIKEMYPEAASQLQTIIGPGGHGPEATALGETFQKGGFRSVLKYRLDQLLKNQDLRSQEYEIVRTYARLGQMNEAIATLERLFAARGRGIVYIKSDPVLDPLHSDPRFQNLVRRINYPSN
jgi:tetratricopeptide (TPR) repeat protein